MKKPKLRPGAWEWLGWGLYTEWIIWNLGVTHEGEYTETDKAHLTNWGLSTAWIVAGANIAARIGLGPIATVLAAFHLGKYASHAIDPDEGEEKFLGFISAGTWEGSQEPDYGSPQRPGSGGYFDIAGNLAIVITNWETYEDRRIKAEKEQEEQDIVNQWIFRKSLRFGQMNSTQLWEAGYITTEDYNSRLHKVMTDQHEIAAAEKFKKQVKAKWNKLSKTEQTQILDVKRNLQWQINAMSW